jgi:hypothetical protein
MTLSYLPEVYASKWHPRKWHPRKTGIDTMASKKDRYRHNGEKSAVMVFNVSSEEKAQVEAEEWELSHEKVEIKQRYKYLGVEMLTNVNDWRTYVGQAIAKTRWVSQDLSCVTKAYARDRQLPFGRPLQDQ